MSDKPTKVPEWNRDLANNAEPLEAKKDLGFYVGEDPSSTLTNWLLNLTGRWLGWLNERATDIGVAPRIGLRGIETTGEGGGTGVTATGEGAAPGVLGTGGATAGSGVKGVGGAGDGAGVDATGSGNGAGVLAVASGTAPAVSATGSGAGPGVHGTSTATGYGVIAEGKAAAPEKASLRVAPQAAAPSVPLEGDVYTDSVTKRMRYYNGTAWTDLSGWELLAEHISVGDEADVDITIPARDELLIIFDRILPSGVIAQAAIGFNGDGGNNYRFRLLTAVAGGAVLANTEGATQALIALELGTNKTQKLFSILVGNFQTKPKVVKTVCAGATNDVAVNPTVYLANDGEWVNSADQITELNFQSSGAGDLCGAGSKFLIFGRSAA